MGDESVAEQLILRITFAVLLALVAFVGISLPGRLRKDSTLLPIANGCGGGVILSAALTHMLPESSNCDRLSGFPWGPAMLGAGYLFLLSVEIVVDRIAHAATMHSLACCQTPLVSCEHSTAPAHASEHAERAPRSPRSDTCESLLEAQPCNVGRHLLEQVPCGQDGAHASLPDLAVCASHTGLSGDRKRRPFAAFAATCGLSVHALLEGMALGLRRSSDDFAILCVTIALHKGFAALALGAVLADRPDWLRRSATLAFCMATPVGISAGSALLATTSCTVTAPLGAFSAGSLMWVALHEVISPATQRNRVLPVLCATWLGFGAMTVLAIWV